MSTPTTPDTYTAACDAALSFWHAANTIRDDAYYSAYAAYEAANASPTEANITTATKTAACRTYASTFAATALSTYNETLAAAHAAIEKEGQP